ncbi:hypothetical protein Slin15195_G076260 [Septoria linicola]|uniref:Uncharacterized protein n=1 Tax=Septoria linicola TaxID=215465 RepID=A0A9Q9ARB8_9PEZI|nr:hypothetical protein Slin15195_G076260 [Septoria linicola]
MLDQRPHTTEPGHLASIRRQASKSVACSPKIALEVRLQSLPPELQDAILLLVLESSLAKGVVNLSKSYRPPWQLNVNSYSRRMLSGIHYGDDTTFCHTLMEDTSVPGKPDRRYFNRWLASLDEDQLSRIGDIRLSMPFPAMVDRTRNSPNRVTITSPRSLWELESRHMHQSPGLHRGVLRVLVPVGTSKLRWISAAGPAHVLAMDSCSTGHQEMAESIVPARY